MTDTTAGEPGDGKKAMELTTEGPWERVLTPRGWVVEGPPAGAEGNPKSLICSVPLGGNAQAISATPDLIRATRLSLEWAPVFIRPDLEEALVKAGAMEKGEELQLTCSEPGCNTSDGTVTTCDWCPRRVCPEHDDVLSNRGIDSDLTLCTPCGERYDQQAMRDILSEMVQSAESLENNGGDSARGLLQACLSKVKATFPHGL